MKVQINEESAKNLHGSILKNKKLYKKHMNINIPQAISL